MKSLPVAASVKSRCPKCDSTDREAYHNVKELPSRGKTADGRNYNLVVWRRTKCKNCGQMRIDRTFELQSAKKKSK